MAQIHVKADQDDINEIRFFFGVRKCQNDVNWYLWVYCLDKEDTS